MLPPVHVCPSPMYPVLHWQVKDPAVFVHTALTSHVPRLALHSLISVRQNNIDYYKTPT